MTHLPIHAGVKVCILGWGNGKCGNDAQSNFYMFSSCANMYPHVSLSVIPNHLTFIVSKSDLAFSKCKLTQKTQVANGLV